MVHIGSTVRLQCPVTSTSPAIASWSKDSEPVYVGWQRYRAVRSGTVSGGQLQIVEARQADSGKFKCDATNGFGSTSVTIRLHVISVRRLRSTSTSLQTTATMESGNSGRRKLKVAVIGAGAAGLVAARHLSSRPTVFQSPEVFEQTMNVGGTWVYTDDVGKDPDTDLPIHSSMYRHMRTNLPKEVMAFPDLPFSDNLPSFMSHYDVRHYLDYYSKHFDLHKFIKFGHVVESVSPQKSRDQIRDVEWHVDIRNMTSGVTSHDVYDAIIACNGHYFDPLTPEGLDVDKFEGRVLHSHDYRSPDSFTGRSVVIFGAGPSGVDIAIELSSVAKHVYLCHNMALFPPDSLPDNVVQKVGIDRMTSDGAILQDGDSLKFNTLILCTGYRYAFPFLCYVCRPTLLYDGLVVDGLYRHLIHARYPTLSFIGIPKRVCPFPLFDRQVRYVLGTLDGTVVLPSSDDMMELTQREMKDLVATGVPARHYHVLGRRQWAYNDQLAADGQFEPLLPVISRLYDHVTDIRRSSLRRYKNFRYDIVDDSTFVHVK